METLQDLSLAVAQAGGMHHPANRGVRDEQTVDLKDAQQDTLRTAAPSRCIL